MNATIMSLATRVGSIRNQFGALIEPNLDEIALGVSVAHDALSQLPPGEKTVDRVIFASSGIRAIFPSGAIAIATELGLRCVAFDVTAACASMCIAVELAAAMNGRSLIVGADSMSRTIDCNEPSHLPLQRFADGAAALVIGKDQCTGQRIMGHCGVTDGRWRTYYQAAGGKIRRSLPVDLKADLRACYIESWVEIAQRLMQQRECDGRVRIYPNQGDRALFPDLVLALGLSEDQLVTTDHGHAGGADPWIGLNSHPLSRGDSAILLSSGIGFEFHGILIEYV